MSRRSVQATRARQASSLQNRELEVEETTIQVTQHTGPLPAPEVLADYERLQPGMAAVLVEMARAEQDHRQSQERARLQADIKHREDVVALRVRNARGTFRSDLVGQACGFAIAGACVCGALYTAMHGGGWEIVAAFLSLPVAGIIKAMRNGSEPKPEEPPKK